MLSIPKLGKRRNQNLGVPLRELLLAPPGVDDLLSKRLISAIESDEKARCLAAHKACATTREQHDQFDCDVDVPGGRATLPATREFEVNDFFINLEVAFSQKAFLDFRNRRILRTCMQPYVVFPC